MRNGPMIYGEPRGNRTGPPNIIEKRSGSDAADSQSREKVFREQQKPGIDMSIERSVANLMQPVYTADRIAERFGHSRVDLYRWARTSWQSSLPCSLLRRPLRSVLTLNNGIAFATSISLYYSPRSCAPLQWWTKVSARHAIFNGNVYNRSIARRFTADFYAAISKRKRMCTVGGNVRNIESVIAFSIVVLFV